MSRDAEDPVVDRSTTRWKRAAWLDSHVDGSTAHRLRQHSLDRLSALAKVGVAGSNPVVRSIHANPCFGGGSLAFGGTVGLPGRGKTTAARRILR